MNEREHFKFAADWLAFLNGQPSEEELAQLSAEWKLDLGALLGKVEETERAILQEHLKPKRFVFKKPAELAEDERISPENS